MDHFPVPFQRDGVVLPGAKEFPVMMECHLDRQVGECLGMQACREKKRPEAESPHQSLYGMGAEREGMPVYPDLGGFGKLQQVKLQPFGRGINAAHESPRGSWLFAEQRPMFGRPTQNP